MDMTRETITEIVSGYLQHGLVENNPEKIALARDITISGNGRLEARGVDAAHELLRSEAAAAIEKVTVKKWVIEGEEVATVCDLHRSDDRLVVAIHYFRIYDGKIREVRVDFGVHPTPQEMARYTQSS